MDSLCAGLDDGRKARRNFGKSFASTPITPLPQRLYTLHTTKKKSKQPRPEKQFPKNPLRRTDAGRARLQLAKCSYNYLCWFAWKCPLLCQPICERGLGLRFCILEQRAGSFFRRIDRGAKPESLAPVISRISRP